VGKHADEHLRRFIAARARGDAAAMRKWWDELVVDFYDRIDGFVAGAHKGRLDADEHELAVMMSMVRFSNRLIATFSGVSMGELVNATKTLARGICIDVQRQAVRDHRFEGPSLDEPERPEWERGESERRYDDEQSAADARDFVSWALPQIDLNRRRVLELTLYGAEISEIMQELGITRENAYQRRSRGLKDLAKLKERYEA
jgi:hypothetical protein